MNGIPKLKISVCLHRTKDTILPSLGGMYDDNYACMPLKCSEPSLRWQLLCDQIYELRWKTARFSYENVL